MNIYVLHIYTSTIIKTVVCLYISCHTFSNFNGRKLARVIMSKSRIQFTNCRKKLDFQDIFFEWHKMKVKYTLVS